MASNYTSNYNLCQWVKSDKVLMEDFNADNAKIDAALAGKASTSALNSLKTVVDGLKASKADKSALESLAAAVAGQGAALAKKGNCAVYTAAYTGDGASGVRNPKTLTFPARPLAVAVGGGAGYMVMVQGAEAASVPLNGMAAPNTLTWSGNSVSWFHNGSSGAAGMLNSSGTAYFAIALVDAG